MPSILDRVTALMKGKKKKVKVAADPKGSSPHLLTAIEKIRKRKKMLEEIK